jgi:glycine/D-amino acid oxidase-like deaminating enzyme
VRSLLFRARSEGLARLERYQREGTRGGLEIDLLGANDVRRRFPYLGPDVCGATWSKRDGTGQSRGWQRPRSRAPRVRSARTSSAQRVVALEPRRRFFVPPRTAISFRGAVRRQRGRRLGQRDSPKCSRDIADVSGGPPNFRDRAAAVFHHSALQDCRAAR